MTDYIDKDTFNFPVSTNAKKSTPQDESGWTTYATESDGTLLQKKEETRGTSTITKFRRVLTK